MNIVFVSQNGNEKTVEFAPGETILQVAERNGVAIHTRCEGFGVCGCCHVIIENMHDLLPEISDVENDGLDKAKNVEVRSRLACKVTLSAQMDGMRVKIP